MDLMEAMRQRHSVRSYLDKPIEGETLTALEREIEACNRESGLCIQLVRNEPKAFSTGRAKYGAFSGVTNYLAMVGPKGASLEETCGYYGERLVLLAQTLGLGTCWVALTFQKIPDAFAIGSGEKLAALIAIGYGETQGSGHKVKAPEEVSDLTAASPDWYRKGIEAALLAPTAVNQQKFKFSLSGSKVAVRPGVGFYTKLDLGIVKYHFELGAGTEQFSWA